MKVRYFGALFECATCVLNVPYSLEASYVLNSSNLGKTDVHESSQVRFDEKCIGVAGGGEGARPIEVTPMIKM